MKRLFVACMATILLLAAGIVIWGHLNSRQAPLVHRARIALPNWPQGAAPVQVLLMSDIHLGNWSMDVSRLNRIVDAANALHPDLVLIAGDFLAGYDNSPERAGRLVLPLSRLHAPLGVIAAIGNHDRSGDPAVVPQALTRAGLTVLLDQAVRRGPLAIGGAVNGYDAAHLVATAEQLRLVGGAPVLIAHEPDDAAKRPLDMPLMLVGHTHCGQVVLPLIGPLTPGIVKDQRYMCGAVRDAPGMTIVTGGLGTSDAPFRFGAAPDMWLLTLGPSLAKRS
ncbi:metallophosphoesterase [Sphingomonas abietis]|uniref:Metallophosphoesterase n=1 Tax=Sphingomonas abietis TaxID=3012344 RepID=A0ABY7NJQ4_9SPHN|nr:metallophosphoesterase [Sphingomonas abietis]WBO20863.1 metallophosphoesterase [Sphingomonas abietis]